MGWRWRLEAAALWADGRMRTSILALTIMRVALLIAPLQAVAEPAVAQSANRYFQYKDWGLQCDNTRTCRAEGYQAEVGESEPVSMLLTRVAGPGTEPQIALQVSTEKAFDGPLQLKIGRVVVGGLSGDIMRLTAAQVQLALPELLKNQTASVTAASRNSPQSVSQWTLSLAGVNAVLLKMDEAQGRLGTPGALVRKGSRPESQVPEALAPPQIKGALPAALRDSDTALAKPIFAAIDAAQLRQQCSGPSDVPPTVYRLSANQVLLSVACAMGAYNGTELLWLANDKPPYSPRLLDMDGEFDQTDASVHSAHKGRGLGDCWSFKSWQWDGVGFVLSDVSGNFMCRGFAGGAWQLPVFVTQTVFPAKAPSPKR
jgi:Protein of unknown function (DUF1176)